MPTASSASLISRVPHLRDSLSVAKVGLAALLFAVLPLNAQQPATLSTGQTPTATVNATSTYLHLGHHRIALKRDNIELADDGLLWSPTTQTLTLRWLTPPTAKPNTFPLHIGSDGRALSQP